MVTAVVLVATLGLVWWRGQGDEPYVAPTPDAPASAVDSAAASQTLRDFRIALQDGDGAAAAALGADDATSKLLSTIADNVAATNLTDLGFRYLSASDGPVTADGWSATVEVTWRHGGFDGQSAARGNVEFGFAAGGTAIAAIGAENGLAPLWLQGPIAVERGGGALVITTGDQDVTALHRRAQQAVAAMRTTFGGTPRLVVQAPDTVDGLHRAIGAPADDYHVVAAVVTGADGSLVPGTPLHIFLNPDVYNDLDEVAGQVVMTHEAVHVVTEAPFARAVPLWLHEGVADFVALREVDLPLQRKAAQIIDRVATEGVPDRLPNQLDFAHADGHLGATYEAAWLVCEVLAERRGADELLALYQAVLVGSDLERELAERFGWSEDELLAAWQQRLQDLAEGA